MRHGRSSLRQFIFTAITIVAPSASTQAVIVGGNASVDLSSLEPVSSLGVDTPWNYSSHGGMMGTAIAPHFFASARHLGYGVGGTFNYNGQNYTTTAYYDAPDSDLRLWQVDGDLGTYAPLETSTQTEGLPLFIVGRGLDRGAPIRTAAGTFVGWSWGADSGTLRWGLNTAGPTVDGTDAENPGPQLTARFNGTDDATVAPGDSGGGFFVRDDGAWKLAGVAYSIDDAFVIDGQTVRGAIIGQTMYASSIAGNLPWIESIIGSDLGPPVVNVVPEPASIGLLATAGSAILFRRKRTSQFPQIA